MAAAPSLRPNKDKTTMVRIIGGIIGLGFAFVLMLAFYGTVTTPAPAETAAEKFHVSPRSAGLSSDGVFGKFDLRQVQRGFQVYKDVCSACHSLHMVSFRDLKDLGYSDPEVKAIAKQWDDKAKQPTFDAKTGQAGERGNIPSDRIPMVYYAAQGSPPDLSLIAKARHGGGDYVYSLLTGYKEQPAELLKEFPDAKTPDGLYFNPHFANLNISMPPPLTAEGQVQYADGTKATVDQMAKDVSAFLVWTAEPTLQKRHSAGFATLAFLLLFCFLAYGAYQSVWAGKKH